VTTLRQPLYGAQAEMKKREIVNYAIGISILGGVVGTYYYSMAAIPQVGTSTLGAPQRHKMLHHVPFATESHSSFVLMFEHHKSSSQTHLHSPSSCAIT
jgi:TPP-dependent 2-oxoacid decarboxylase